MHFNNSVIVATKDGESAGDDWSASVIYTYGSPSSAVLLSSVSTDSTTSGAYLHIATLEFEAISAGSTDVAVEVIEVLGATSGATTDTILTSGTEAIAAYGSVVVTNERRTRRLRASPPSIQQPNRPGLWGSQPTLNYEPHWKTSRRLEDSSSCDTIGDVTGDCGVTISDIALMLRSVVDGRVRQYAFTTTDSGCSTRRYISDPAGYPDASTSAMDVDYNDKVNIIDASFLQ